MRQIQLSNGMTALVDEDDYEPLNRWKWYARKIGNTFYAVRNIPGAHRNHNKLFMHREILNSPKGKQVDHINGNGLDNRKINLRECTPAENRHNMHARRGISSKYKGVCWVKNKKKWQAAIMTNGKRHWLGYYANEIEAAFAYDQAAIKYFGEFSNLNFPKSTNCMVARSVEDVICLTKGA